MQSAFSNPLFSSGLANLVNSFVGNPQSQANTELLTSKARLNNDTTRFREDIGTAGREGDLASLLISSLQAGKDFSSEAPEITSAIASLPGSGFSRQQMGDIQVGAGVQRASGTFAGQNRGGRGRGGVSGKPLSAGGRSTLLSNLKGQGVEGSGQMVVLSWVDDQVRKGMPENEAIAFAAQNLNRERLVTNPAGTMLSRLFGGGDGPPDAIEDVGTGPVTGVSGLADIIGGGTGQGVGQQSDLKAVLAEAQAAIKGGADPLKVKQRLIEMGVDVSGF